MRTLLLKPLNKKTRWVTDKTGWIKLAQDRLPIFTYELG